MPVWAIILIVVLVIGAATGIILFCVYGLGKGKSDGNPNTISNGNPNTISNAARQSLSAKDAEALLPAISAEAPQTSTAGTPQNNTAGFPQTDTAEAFQTIPTKSSQSTMFSKIMMDEATKAAYVQVQQKVTQSASQGNLTYLSFAELLKKWNFGPYKEQMRQNPALAPYVGLIDVYQQNLPVAKIADMLALYAKWVGLTVDTLTSDDIANVWFTIRDPVLWNPMVKAVEPQITQQADWTVARWREYSSLFLRLSDSNIRGISDLSMIFVDIYRRTAAGYEFSESDLNPLISKVARVLSKIDDADTLFKLYQVASPQLDLGNNFNVQLIKQMCGKPASEIEPQLKGLVALFGGAYATYYS